MRVKIDLTDAVHTFHDAIWLVVCLTYWLCCYHCHHCHHKLKAMCHHCRYWYLWAYDDYCATKRRDYVYFHDRSVTLVSTTNCRVGSDCVWRPPMWKAPKRGPHSRHHAMHDDDGCLMVTQYSSALLRRRPTKRLQQLLCLNFLAVAADPANIIYSIHYPFHAHVNVPLLISYV